MIMSTVAQAVHRGSDGSVHYLSSTPTGSMLIIADPVLGVSRIRFDGLCRLIPRDPRLPAGYDAVQYLSISAAESTRVTVRPGRAPFLHTIGGVCWECMLGEHDFGLWPVCPRGGGERVGGYGPGPAAVREGEDVESVDLYRVTPSRPTDAVEAPAPVLEAVPEVEPAAPVHELPQVPEVSLEVEQAAAWLATKVWSGGAMPRGRLAPYGVPSAAIDTYLGLEASGLLCRSYVGCGSRL